MRVKNNMVNFPTGSKMARKGARKVKWSPQSIRDLRERYGESQPAFAPRLGITVEALRVWEQGKGIPGGSAQLLLDRLQEDAEQGRIRQLATAAS
jgi:DNA-binding transcriptional regulator YiaG